ncbi:MAG: hypothetical protein EHM61_04025 [Acidobacteria bacterium]|nr:MAG: hypothetical protein EHM61_04025 [Acidobacteriota bacterium]
MAFGLLLSCGLAAVQAQAAATGQRVRAASNPADAIHDLELILERALSIQPDGDDGVTARTKIRTALAAVQTSFGALTSARNTRNQTGAVVLNAALDSDISGETVPKFESLERVVDLIRQVALLRPCESEFDGELLAGILNAALPLYRGESQAKISRWRNDWVDWDDGRIGSAIQFDLAQQIFKRRVRPLLGWQRVQTQALAGAVQSLDAQYSLTLTCLRAPRNVPVVYSTHSDQLDEVGRRLSEGDLQEKIRYRRKSCQVLADGIGKATTSSDAPATAAWLNNARQVLFERVENLIRQDLLPRRMFNEILSVSVEFAEKRPEGLTADSRARLFAYAAQCSFLRGDNKQAGHFFDRANYLAPGILTQEDLRNLKAKSQP